MLTVKEIAERWKIPEQQVTRYCRMGRISGAKKDGRTWLIPGNAKKPVDLRRKINDTLYNNVQTKLPLPVGVSDFRVACDEYYYIDKTMLIKEFLDEKAMVSLFTRPRRFGKTLNMDMLRVFFEKSEQDTSIYFRDKMIWKCGEYYQKYQGKYPVIFLTFKDLKFDTWDETLQDIRRILSKEFHRHNEVLKSTKCDEYEKKFYRKILSGEATNVEMMSALLQLSQMLHEHHGVAPIIIIDEYDTPIQQGHMCGFYDEVILFMRNLFSGAFKDNRHLSYGFLTGILRVAKESMFSGLNNLKINSILDYKYGQYFGFTLDEVENMAEYYGVPEKIEEICKWYDGYRFGKNEIFNPWSVINYFNNECTPGAFWVSTGSNEIIGEMLEGADDDIFERLKMLLQGESFTTLIDTNVIYPQIKKNPSSVYSFLLVAGYLKVLQTRPSISGDHMCEVALPNKEIAYVFNKEILEKLNNVVPQFITNAIQEAIYTNDAEELKKQLEKLLLESASCFDTVGENFYHGLVLGLCASMNNRYYISSNRESGNGRYDIQIMPKREKMPGILIELKAEKNCSDKQLKEMSQMALQQIKDKKYEVEMQKRGVESIFKFGVAFSGKNVEVASE